VNFAAVTVKVDFAEKMEFMKGVGTRSMKDVRV
jgi:hypothetical protein